MPQFFRDGTKQLRVDGAQQPSRGLRKQVTEQFAPFQAVEDRVPLLSLLVTDFNLKRSIKTTTAELY
jgi:hypothetical protein